MPVTILNRNLTSQLLLIHRRRKLYLCCSSEWRLTICSFFIAKSNRPVSIEIILDTCQCAFARPDQLHWQPNSIETFRSARSPSIHPSSTFLFSSPLFLLLTFSQMDQNYTIHYVEHTHKFYVLHSTVQCTHVLAFFSQPRCAFVCRNYIIWRTEKVKRQVEPKKNLPERATTIKKVEYIWCVCVCV